MRSSGRGFLGFLAVAWPLAVGAPSQSPQFRVVGEVIRPQSFDVQGGPVAGMDMDTDGDVDLLPSFGSILLNDGSARFQGDPSVFMAPGAAVARVADLNSDGLPDALAATWSGVVRWMNQVGSLVQTNVGLPAVLGGWIVDIAVGDVDGDLDVDAVLGMVTPCGFPPVGPSIPCPVQIGLLLNNGDGSFVDASAQVSPPAITTQQIALADFDGDGDLDLLATERPDTVIASNPRLILWNDGTGVFSLSATTPGTGALGDTFAVGDLNGDGLADIVFDTLIAGSPATELVLSLGGGEFSAPITTTQSIRGWPVLLDVDGDGVVEVVRLGDRGVSVHPVTLWGGVGAPSQVLAIFTSQPQLHVVADLDSDGDADVALDTPQAPRILLNDAQGALQPIASHLSMPSSSCRLGDIDGDGDLDLLGCSTSLGGPLVAWNNGIGHLEFAPPITPAGGPAATLPCSTQFESHHPIDADGDGDLDLFVRSLFGPPPYGRILINSGGGVWTRGEIVSLPGPVVAVAVGDLDGDLDSDLVLGAAWSGGPPPGYIVFNLGGGVFSEPGLLAGHFVNQFLLMDADGDSDLDIFEANADPCALLLNNGFGKFTPSPTFSPPPAVDIAGGDLDGDGDPDLVLGATIHLNDGTGVFTPIMTLPPPQGGAGTGRLFAFDADADLDLDLVSIVGLLYRNPNNAAFGTPEPATSPGNLMSVVDHGDIDGDGDEDILSYQPRIYMNVARQLSRGSIARPGRWASLDVFGPSSATYALFAAPTPANISLPPFGTAFIDPWTAIVVAAGSFDAEGSSVYSVFVPASSSLVGSSVFWQAAVQGPTGPHLTNTEITTILAY